MSRQQTKRRTGGTPQGGGWNIAQASEWSTIGEHQLRGMAQRNEIPHIKIGRRILIPKEAFVRWFNSRGTVSAA
jgi:excisionase family DNA binding protein